MEALKQIRLGDRSVAQLGQGTWNMGDSIARRKGEIAALRRGIELGMSVIDTAEMYGDGRSEILVGEAIAGNRDEVYLVSKVLPSNASGKGTVRACEASLKRLGVEALDLYLLHWPGRFPLADTVEGFENLIRQGKIRSWGVSNFDVAGMDELMSLPQGNQCIANQILYNPEYRGVEFDLLQWCNQQEVTAMAYSPVGQGGDLLKAPVLVKVAQAHGVTSAQVVIAWGMRKAVLSIPKAGSVEHVNQNAAAGNLTLPESDLAEIDEAFPAPARKQRLAVL